MKIDFNLLVIFQLFVIVQGFSTSFLLIKSNYEQRQNRWLGFLILAMTFQTIDSFLTTSGTYQTYRWLYFSPLFYSWSYGALLYFYIQTSVNQSFAFSKNYYIHFLPLLIQFLFFTFISLHSFDYKTWFWFNVHKPYTRYVSIYVGIGLVFGYLYTSYETAKKIDPRFQRFLLALVIFYIIAAIDPLVNDWYLPKHSPKFYLIEYILPIFTYWLGLTVYFKEKDKKKTKIQNGGFNQEYLQKIIQNVESQQLYFNSELSLSDVSEVVNLNTSIVSATLNNGLNQSFNDFINEYRIEAIKTKLQKGEHLKHTLLGIAFDCGFNSKNTFNRAFKKSTGVSPKEWIENYQKDSPKL
jgi:AraC-like DNA-binding protein